MELRSKLKTILFAAATPVALALLLLVTCAWLASCGGGGTAETQPPPPTAAPQITWSATSVGPILSPGESTSQNVTFRSDRSFQNAVLEATGNIAGFVTISPSSIVNVSAGQDQAVKLTFSVPSGTALGTLNGAVQVRSGGQSLSQTIAVGLNVWQTQLDQASGYSIKFPPSLHAQQPVPGKTSFSKESLVEGSDEPAPIEIFALPTPLDQVLQQIRTGFVRDELEQNFLVSNEPAVRITGLLSRDVFGFGGRRHGFVLFAHAGRTYKLQYDLEDAEVTTIFDLMVQTLRFTS